MYVQGGWVASIVIGLAACTANSAYGQQLAPPANFLPPAQYAPQPSYEPSAGYEPSAVSGPVGSYSPPEGSFPPQQYAPQGYAPPQGYVPPEYAPAREYAPPPVGPSAGYEFVPPPQLPAPATLQTPPPEEVTSVLPPPSELEPAPEYSFFDPGYWFPTDGWSNSFEIGINGSTGNSETFSMRTGAHLKRKVEASTFSLDLKYARTLADSVETQHNALLNSNVETDLGDTRWTTFFKTSFEYDEFKAWDARAAMNAGVGYHLIKAEDATFIARFGSGVSREIGGPEDDYVPEAVYGLEFDRQLTKRQKFYGTIDYFPDWTDYADYRLVTTAGWEVLLDAEANLSLKLGATDRYDSTPHGRKPNDLDYSLVLLWKN